MNEFLKALNSVHGPVRKMDDLGRIVVPKEMRKMLGLNQNDKLEIVVVEDYVVLKPVKATKNERGAGRKSKFTEEQIQQIREARAEGKTIKAIAEEFGCSVGSVHRLTR